jgi:hypothetical protein
MELLTEELRAQLSPLYAQERIKEKDKIVYAKFFSIASCSAGPGS